MWWYIRRLTDECTGGLTNLKTHTRRPIPLPAPPRATCFHFSLSLAPPPSVPPLPAAQLRSAYGTPRALTRRPGPSRLPMVPHAPRVAGRPRWREGDFFIFLFYFKFDWILIKFDYVRLNLIAMDG
jgi:hypothetical protein